MNQSFNYCRYTTITEQLKTPPYLYEGKEKLLDKWDEKDRSPHWFWFVHFPAIERRIVIAILMNVIMLSTLTQNPTVCRITFNRIINRNMRLTNKFTTGAFGIGSLKTSWADPVVKKISLNPYIDENKPPASWEMLEEETWGSWVLCKATQAHLKWVIRPHFIHQPVRFSNSDSNKASTPVPNRKESFFRIGRSISTITLTRISPIWLYQGFKKQVLRLS